MFWYVWTVFLFVVGFLGGRLLAKKLGKHSGGK
jgi:hypothetical protein